MLGRSEVLTLVLAGGAGERLRPLTNERCKPAVHFGGCFRLIDFSLMNCVSSSIAEIFLLTQYRAESLDAHCERHWGFLSRSGVGQVKTLPPGQPGGYRGTADAVYRNLELLREVPPRVVLVLSADHVYHADYRALLAFHMARRADVTILTTSVPAGKASSFGVLETDESARVMRFVEKPSDPAPHARSGMCSINLGVYCFRPAFLVRTLEADARDARSSHDFGRDVLPRTLAEGARVLAFPLAFAARRPYWRDVGTIESFFEANMDLVREHPPFRLMSDDWPRGAPFRDWVPREFRSPPNREARNREARNLAAPGVATHGATVRRVVLCRGARIEEDAHLEDCVLLPGAEVGRGARLRRVIVDEGSRVPADTEMGLDARADDVPLVYCEKASSSASRDAR